MSSTKRADVADSNPYADIVGKTELTFQCGVATSDYFEADDPEYCPHEPETITLDEPAFVDERGRVHLPGRPHECPECGNPNEFRFDGLAVMFP